MNVHRNGPRCRDLWGAPTGNEPVIVRRLADSFERNRFYFLSSLKSLYALKILWMEWGDAAAVFRMLVIKVERERERERPWKTKEPEALEW